MLRGDTEWFKEDGTGFVRARIFGLASVLFTGGVRHYVGTFWEILDEAGSYIAEGFYDGLVRGESIGEGLRKPDPESSCRDLIESACHLLWVWFVVGMTNHGERM